jgi:hypothetical protein
MENERKYKVKSGDPFGGYWTAGENLTIDEAKILLKKEELMADYFTTSHIEDENGKRVNV